jgi:hypothetical protein
LAGSAKGLSIMQFFPKWYEDPSSLDSDKDEDLIQSLDAIERCVEVVRSLMAYGERNFDAESFVQEFAWLRGLLPPTTELLKRLNWELDPITARHGIARVGAVTAGNHLWAARQWVVRYFMEVTAWDSDYMRAVSDPFVDSLSPAAFEWAKDRILDVAKKMAIVDWATWRAHAEQEVTAAIAERNKLRVIGATPPIVAYGQCGPATTPCKVQNRQSRDVTGAIEPAVNAADQVKGAVDSPPLSEVDATHQMTLATTSLPIEQNIIGAISGDCLTANEIAPKAGYPNNSNFRSKLAEMKRRGILVGGPNNRGYCVASNSR